MNKGKNILLVENSAADFYKSRLKYAKFLIGKGFNVFALIPEDSVCSMIEAQGVHIYTYRLNRNTNWLSQIFKTIGVYRKIFKEQKIDIVHSYRFFPNIINILIGVLSSRKKIVHITGLGIAYSNTTLKYRIYKHASNVIYFLMVLLSDAVVVQNPDDLRHLTYFKFMQKKLKLIKGSGVDADYFNPDFLIRNELRKKYQFNENDILFICVTRLIWEKGILELVDGFEANCKEFRDIKLLIVGYPDINNPRHVSLEYINNFANHPNIKFLGKRSDIRELLRTADVFIYPSYYREGIPRSVLEALSTGLPIITTNTPGCNLTVTNNENGILISPRSAKEIRTAIKTIITQEQTPSLTQMGKVSRKLAVEQFADSVIYKQMEMVYEI